MTTFRARGSCRVMLRSERRITTSSQHIGVATLVLGVVPSSWTSASGSDGVYYEVLVLNSTTCVRGSCCSHVRGNDALGLKTNMMRSSSDRLLHPTLDYRRFAMIASQLRSAPQPHVACGCAERGPHTRADLPDGDEPEQHHHHLRAPGRCASRQGQPPGAAPALMDSPCIFYLFARARLLCGPS